MSQRIKVEREVLVWARERSGLLFDELVSEFPDYATWESGEGRPTLKQLEELARKTRTALGSFFLNRPAEDRLPIPDYRTKQDAKPARPGPDLMETLAMMQQRRQWLSERLREGEAARPAFVGAATLAEMRHPAGVAAAAARMKEMLSLSDDWAQKSGDADGALRTLRRAMEKAGAIIAINSVVGLNNRRRLSVDEFRGFALADAYAPLIFVNGADASTAKVFTLVHEFAHLMLGSEGVSSADAAEEGESPEIETACNRFAAEFLVPGAILTALWPTMTGPLGEIFQRLAARFRVSPIVVGRRAMDLGLVKRSEFFNFHAEYRRAWEGREPAEKKKGTPSFYTVVGVKLGHRFAAEVFAAAKSGELLYRDAYRLTGLSGPSFERLSKSYELGYGR